MLIRPKKGKSIEERLQDITKNAVFSRLLEEKSPDVFQKLIAVSGIRLLPFFKEVWHGNLKNCI